MKFMISLLGWFLWNWAELTIEKKTLDDDGNPQTTFSIKDFMGKKWTIWIGSLACVPLLLWLGANQMGLHPMEGLIEKELKWDDLYYIASGLVFEFIIFAVTFYKRKFK